MPDDMASDAKAVKDRIRALVRERFGVTHTTLEIERASECHEVGDAKPIGHHIGHQH